MRKILFYLSFMIQMLVVLPVEAIQSNSDKGFTVLEENSNGITLDFTLPDYTIDSQNVNGTKYQLISMENGADILQIGKPQLPHLSRLVAIPNKGSAHIKMIDHQSKFIKNIKIYPQQSLQNENDNKNIPFEIDEEYYRGDEIFPAKIVETDKPAIMRDLRLVNISINPFRYYPAENKLEVITKMSFTIEFSSQTGENEKTRFTKKSRAFYPLYRAAILNENNLSFRDAELQNPCYLFIYPNEDEVLSTLQPLLDWKHEKGFEVHAVSTTETGSSLNSIKAYIQNAYDNWGNPPEFLCLVGDAAGNFVIPADHLDGGFYNGEGDQTYALLEGDDILADVFLGRLSFNTIFQLQTIVNKILNYEKNPYIGNTDWYTKALLVGDPNDSGPSTVTTNLFIKEMIEYEEPDFSFTEVYDSPFVNRIANTLNEGVSYFHYRGFANMSGWDIGDINSLNNGYMLPAVTHITCITGDYEGTSDCRSEAFLKAGSPSNPKGAIAAVGTSTGNTHTCFNNCVSGGVFTGIFKDKIYNMGGSLARGKLNLYENYPGNPANHVAQFSYWNNLMGDPGLELWTNIPQQLILEYTDPIPLGSNYVQIHVKDTDSNPVENVFVCLLQGDEEIFVTGYSDEMGNVRLQIPDNATGTLLITASKHNFIPVQNNVDITPTNEFISVDSYILDDDNSGQSSGNGNSHIGNGETIELYLNLKNNGTSDSGNLNVIVFCPNEHINLTSSLLTIADIPAGETAQLSEPVLFTVDHNILSGEEVNFEIDISDDNGNTWQDYISENSESFYLIFSDYEISDNNDNILNPGETANITALLENNGITETGNFTITLNYDEYVVSIPQNVISFDSINSGATVAGNQSVTITAHNDVYLGTSTEIQVTAENEYGFMQNFTFLLQIGEVDIHDPLGPDTFGYYFFDDGDEDYIEKPFYNWIEINPQFGGNGTNLNLVDNGNEGDIETISLPFTLKFYGIEYNDLTICSNGWVSPGITEVDEFMNWQVPGPMGPSPMIAPFWDDLRIDQGNVFTFYNETVHTFIVEWSNLNNEYNNAPETFEMIIYDPEFYHTYEDNNRIDFQYKEIHNVDQGMYGFDFVAHGQYCTIGIEDESGTKGLQYTFNNSYPQTAKPLQNEMVIALTPKPEHFNEAHLVYDDITFNDTNQNGNIDIGETINLRIELFNNGNSAAHNITSTLIIEDPNIDLLSSTSAYEDIDPWNSATNLDDFVFEVGQNIPDGYSIDCELDINSLENSWSYFFNLRVNAPRPKIVDIRFIDGNNNIIDPGESGILQVYFQNIGGMEIDNITADTEVVNGDITVNSTGIFLGDIAPNEIKIADFQISASTGATISDIYTLNCILTNEAGFSYEENAVSYISQYQVNYAEDFTIFPPLDWTIEGNNWIPSNTNVAGGTAPEIAFIYAPPTYAIQRFISPMINTLGSNQMHLTFTHTVYDTNSDYEYGIMTTCDGVHWNTALSIEEYNINQQQVDLIINTPDVGSQTFQFAFFFNGFSSNIYAWIIDDVALEEVPVSPHSYISGNITLADGNGDVRNVIISALNYIASPDSTGFYSLTVPMGLYDVRASLVGYASQYSYSIDINQNWQNYTQNFTLNELNPDYTPQNLAGNILGDRIFLTWEIPGFRERENEKILSSSKDRSFIEYKIYRNDEFYVSIDNITTTEFIETGIPDGEYSYKITALYSDGESGPSNMLTFGFALPVVQNFMATPNPNNSFVLLDWDAPENCDNITGYRIYKNGEFLLQTNSLFYIDHDISEGYYLYGVSVMHGTLESAQVEAEVTITGSNDDTLPKITELENNYPNPFNPTTSISFSIASEDAGNIELSIYNIKGQKVKTIANKFLASGRYSLVWDGTDNRDKAVSSGVYFYRLILDKKSMMKRMLMIK